jgi:integrase
MRFERYLERWLDLRRCDLAKSTLARYRTLARNQIVPFVGHVELLDLTPAVLVELYAALLRDGAAGGGRLRSSTIGQVHRLLHVALEAAAEAGIIEGNPADRVRSPRVGGSGGGGKTRYASDQALELRAAFERPEPA